MNDLEWYIKRMKKLADYLEDENCQESYLIRKITKELETSSSMTGNLAKVLDVILKHEYLG